MSAEQDSYPQLAAAAPAWSASRSWQAWTAPPATFVALLAAIVAVYWPGLRAPFIYDDVDAIVTNSSIVRLWPLFDSPGPLSAPRDLPTSGRPLFNLSLAVNYAVGELDPLGYRLFNLLIHAVCATLVWALLRRVLELEYFQNAFEGRAGWLAFGVALVWALHPLLTQAVECVTLRSELLVGTCYVATLYASLRYLTTDVRSQRAIWLALATLACFAGMASKEMMATAPLMVALVHRTFLSRSWRQGEWRRSWPLYVALASSWGLLLALNMGGPRSASAGFSAGVSAGSWWLTQCKVVAMYLKLAFWPSPLVLHYEIEPLGSFAEAWPWVLAVSAVLVATLVLVWRRSAVGFLAAWFFLVLSPTLVVPIATEVAAERRMYLPLVAIVTLVLVGSYWACLRIARRTSVAGQHSPRTWPTAITGSIVLLLATAAGVASARAVALYRDPLAVWQVALDAEPDNVVAHLLIAEELMSRGRDDEALEHCQRLASLSPDSYHAPHMRGALALARGRNQEAIDEFWKVVDRRPSAASPYNNLAVAMNAAGQIESAIPLFEKALQLDPNYAEAHNNLATALANQGQMDKALEHYARAIELNPKLAGAHGSMGVILLNAGRTPEGIDHLAAAAAMQPSVDTYGRLAIACFGARRYSQALEAVEQALSLARGSAPPELIMKLEALRGSIIQQAARAPGQ